MIAASRSVSIFSVGVCLQREANKLYGYTAKQTLDLAHSAGENRRDRFKDMRLGGSEQNYLTDDMNDTAAKTVSLLSGKLPFIIL